METIEINTPSKRGDFSVIKFIRKRGKCYAVIQPGNTSYKIRIASIDFYKALKMHSASKHIYCYPIDGVLIGDTFEEVKYEMVFEGKEY